MINRWLSLLCQMLPGTVQAVVVRRGGGGVMARWPEAVSDLKDLIDAACRAESEDALVCQLKPGGNEHTLLAKPLVNSGVSVGTLCIELPLKTGQRATTELLIDWSVSWLELLSQVSRDRTAGLDLILSLMEQGSRFDNLADNSSSLATALVEAYRLEQVMICAEIGGRAKVIGVSHAPGFDPSSEIFAALERFVREAATTGKDLQHTGYSTWLAEQAKPLACFCLPMRFADRSFASIVVHHALDQVVLEQHRAQMAQAARYLSPLYHSLRQAEESRFGRLRQRWAKWVKEANGRTQALWGGAASCALLALLALPGTHQVKADAQLEGKVQRAIVAPEEGFLQLSEVKSGELISKGQLLAQLDDRAITLEIARWQGEVREYQRQFNRELNALDHVQMRIAKARLAQAEAKLSLFQDRLNRVRITSPIDGVIIKGDLSRAIGSPVERGQVLYEVAPLDQYKLVILVAEQDIRYLQTEQKGKLILSALPHQSVPFQVTSVASVFSETEQSVRYRVEAELDTTHANMRPGMSGVAKISVGKRPYAWLLSHRITDWLTLKLWSI